MSKARLAIALSTLTAVMASWAVPLLGAAHLRFTEGAITKITQTDGTQRAGSGSLLVRLRDTHDRGLLVDAWIKNKGPFVFVVDTGAGTSIISRKISQLALLPIRTSSQPIVGGLSTSAISSNQRATISDLALGRAGTVLTTSFNAAVADGLPGGIDGILDPGDVSPFGYAVDLPARTLEVFDSERRLDENDVSAEGTVVRWLRGDTSKRPFIKLGDGRLAVIDTGSSFGLAVSDGVVSGRNHRRPGRSIHDLGGGAVQSIRVAPTNVSIGSLELRSVPTDLLTGVADATPVIIGRDALYPFRITFDPIAHLIAIEPSSRR